jgi:peptide deformylase
MSTATCPTPADTQNLRIIRYPDPRLRQVSRPVQTFGPELVALVEKMFELMRQDRGVGLAAPQVGVNLRLFVMNPTGKPSDDRAYVNPVLSDPSGDDEAEEGCLSLPKITVKVVRSRRIRITATDAEGKTIEEAADGYVARIWQHEVDHLDGILLLDKMGSLDKLAARRTLRELEEEFAARHPGWKKKAT